MQINECVDFLNFWIRKERGAFYSIPELMQVIDRAQMAYYNDIVPKYATSQIIKDCLSPFRGKFEFTTTDTNDGLLNAESLAATQNHILLDILDLSIHFQEGEWLTYYPVKLGNEDELTDRFNSQIDPMSIKSPVGEQIGKGLVQLYPAVDEYTGVFRYLRRPLAPTYDYTISDGRIINFVGGQSLEWRDSDINMILLKALSSLGINLTDQEVMQYAEAKTQQNYQGVNHQ